MFHTGRQERFFSISANNNNNGGGGDDNGDTFIKLFLFGFLVLLHGLVYWVCVVCFFFGGNVQGFLVCGGVWVGGMYRDF